MNTNEKIRVLAIDDSILVRQSLRELFAREPDIRLYATCVDTTEARRTMRSIWPDVLLVDLALPGESGLEFIRWVMQERPTPIVVCSVLAQHDAPQAVAAMEAGAVALVAKPKAGILGFFQQQGSEIVRAVRAAAQARVARSLAPLSSKANVGSLGVGGGAGVGDSRAGGPWDDSSPRPLAPLAAATAKSTPPPLPTPLGISSHAVIAIGCSTGGPQALETILTRLPAALPGVVVVQHMPPRFTEAFARRLNDLCALSVREARDGDRVLPGTVLIAPGDRHMTLERLPGGYAVAVRDGPPVNRHKPSVDVLFHSVAQVAGRHAVGVILTGMGDDGARGLKAMRTAGARTIAEDASSCVVFGMPRVAIELGAAERVVPLPQIADAILQLLPRG